MPYPNCISANIPLARPGFDALNICAPVLTQCNPGGRWRTSEPMNLDDQILRNIVTHITRRPDADSSSRYCSQCSRDNRNQGIESNKYVPVIMMTVRKDDEWPFDMDSVGRDDANGATDKRGGHDVGGEENVESKPKKRGFVMQRLTDFDLLSQW